MRVLVTGGTGFVGTHLVNRLLHEGHAVAVLARDPRKTRNRYNRPVETVPGDVLDRASLTAAARGREAVVHLVGIIHEKGAQTFDRVHREAAENAVTAAEAAGVSRYLHMSAMGSAADAPSEYGRTKAAGESAVRGSRLAWTMFRPSIVFGPGDGFVSLLAPIVRYNPGFIPVIGAGTTRFQPVSIHDVARVFAAALAMPGTAGRTFEVGGPDVLTLNDIYREIAAAVGKPGKRLVHFPLWYGGLLARMFEMLARRGVLDAPPLTRDQLRSLTRDNVADVSDTVETFGGEWKRFRPGIREYLSSGRHDPRSGIGDEVELERRSVLRVR
ncbi:MAG TPA: complex I NDUFA9 subunit family protein [Thermoanaerobaculia bacterium]|jgi:NADH dehydrogenase|nr:complex I NDUFA9 subunit family protein [Thermoanaerobaculia bacterium]